MIKNSLASALGITTLVDLLQRRGQETPNQLAYTFLRYGEAPNESMTYRELERQAQAIGALLQRHNGIGKRVLLLFPSGLHYVVSYLGCLYAGSVAIPAYPPHNMRSLPRIQNILADSEAAIVLTTASVLSKIQQWRNNIPEISRLTWLTADTLDTQWANEWKKPAVESETLAFLQYTSGSTSTPKGVKVSHGNLLHNLSTIYDCWKLDEQKQPIEVSWLPIFHDMGLIAGILLPLYGGFPAFFMDPADFLQFPLRWLQALSEYHGTISCAPNFAYELCVRRISVTDLADLDLSRWQIALNGAEPIRAETLQRFTRTFAVCGFRPQAFLAGYGLAEGTLLVSHSKLQEQPVVKTVSKSKLEQHVIEEVSEQEQQNVCRLIGCGPHFKDQRLVIVNPETLQRCQSQEVGEIWISSRSVAQGYWQRPEETTRIFHAYLATGEGPFMRTGDLGALLDGNLYITGRLKDLIIIGGRNLYPQDIELTVEQSHKAIRPGCCTAFSVEHEQEERLVILAEVSRQYRPLEQISESTKEEESEAMMVSEQEIIKAIRQAIVEVHDVYAWKVVLLKTGSIPKTSSGKLQHRVSRAAFLEGSLSLWKS